MLGLRYAWVMLSLPPLAQHKPSLNTQSPSPTKKRVPNESSQRMYRAIFALSRKMSLISWQSSTMTPTRVRLGLGRKKGVICSRDAWSQGPRQSVACLTTPGACPLRASAWPPPTTPLSYPHCLSIPTPSNALEVVGVGDERHRDHVVRADLELILALGLPEKEDGEGLDVKAQLEAVHKPLPERDGRLAGQPVAL